MNAAGRGLAAAPQSEPWGRNAFRYESQGDALALRVDAQPLAK